MGFAMLMPCHWAGPNTIVVFMSKVFMSTWPILYFYTLTLLRGIHQKADGDQYYLVNKGGEWVFLPQRLVQDPADDGGEEEEGAGVQ